MFDFIKIIEKNLNKKAKINLKPFQLGDVHKTFADTNRLYKYINYTPQTKIEEELSNSVFGMTITINNFFYQ